MPLARHLPGTARTATVPTAAPALGFVMEGSGGKGESGTSKMPLVRRDGVEEAMG